MSFSGFCIADPLGERLCSRTMGHDHSARALLKPRFSALNPKSFYPGLSRKVGSRPANLMVW
jgi:hypothetical protein